MWEEFATNLSEEGEETGGRKEGQFNRRVGFGSV